MYRKLDSKLICATAEELSQRIGEQFPASSLAAVAAELVEVAAQTQDTLRRVARTHWPIRLATVVLVMLLFGAVIVLPVSISVSNAVSDLSDLMQGIEAAINNVIFLAIAVYFLLTLEMRPRRARALRALHELRSLAHVIDLHQLTKDPQHALHSGAGALAESAHMSQAALARYLDCCSDLLSIISKLAALYAQYLNDSQVLAGVNDVQQLADGLSSRIWQKIMIIDTLGGAPVRPE